VAAILIGIAHIRWLSIYRSVLPCGLPVRLFVCISLFVRPISYLSLQLRDGRPWKAHALQRCMKMTPHSHSHISGTNENNNRHRLIKCWCECKISTVTVLYVNKKMSMSNVTVITLSSDNFVWYFSNRRPTALNSCDYGWALLHECLLPLWYILFPFPFSFWSDLCYHLIPMDFPWKSKVHIQTVQVFYLMTSLWCQMSLSRDLRNLTFLIKATYLLTYHNLLWLRKDNNVVMSVNDHLLFTRLNIQYK